jgi:hypothetical protein
MIKIYRDHGVTNMLGRTNAGAELIHMMFLGQFNTKVRCFIAGADHSLYFNFRDLHHKT